MMSVTPYIIQIKETITASDEAVASSTSPGRPTPAETTLVPWSVKKT